MATKTFDQMAFDILISNKPQAAKQASLSKLAKVARASIRGEMECPECGCAGPHDDNGHTGSNRSFCCSDCGNHFDA